MKPSTFLSVAVVACLLAFTLMLSACASGKPPEPRVVVQRVEVPVRVACKPERPPQPTYAADTVPLDASLFDLVRALLQDRFQRQAHEAELNGALDRCG
jgi:hypothetical protein